jgi:hypothetical protein
MRNILFYTITIVFLMSFELESSNMELQGVNEDFKRSTAYQEGWADGHCEGWKDVKGKYAYCPYPPYAPYPSYPKSSSSYTDGYNDGFKRGTADAQKN